MLKQKEKRWAELTKGKPFFSEEVLHDILDNSKNFYIPLKKIPYHLLIDIKVIKKIIKNNGNYGPDLIKILPDSFKSKNIELMKSMITGPWGYQGFQYLPVKLRKDKRFVLELLETYKNNNKSSDWIYGDTHKDLRNDKDVALMAMRSGGNPYDLPNKFKVNKSMVLACLEYASSRNLSSYYLLRDFKFNKIKLTENFVNLLMQAEPSNYKYLDAKHKNKKEFAMRCIKNDINKYELLPQRLRVNNEIMEYVFSRNPFLCRYLPADNILKKDFSKLNLGKKEREIIYSHCKNQLENQASIFELALAKDIIFKPRMASLKENSFDLSHFDKNKVLKKIDKIASTTPFNKFKLISFYNNISFELKNDIDILLKLVECHVDFRAVCSDVGLVLEKNIELQINKQLFIKRKYREVRLPKKHNKVREYMISKICTEEIHKVNRGLFYRPSFNYSQLKDKERKKVVENSFYYINLFDIRTKVELVKHLSKIQITKMLNNERGFCEDMQYHDFAYKTFGNSFKKNIVLAKRIFLNWPQKSVLRTLDLDYLMKNTSFKKFLENVNEITIHEDDFLSLPGPLKRNKIFVQKVLEYNFKLFVHLPSSLKTNKEITDWIFTIAPRLAKSLALNDYKKIDTSNLHPASRKIIYRQYLRKSSDDIFERALMKRKLLQIKDL